jgi:hypothetical protein
MVLGTKSGDEHEWAYRFATLTVVGENVAFTPAMAPVEKGMNRDEIVNDLVLREMHSNGTSAFSQ